MEARTPDGRLVTIDRDDAGWRVAVQSSPTYSTAVQGRDLSHLLTHVTGERAAASWVAETCARAERAHPESERAHDVAELGSRRSERDDRRGDQVGDDGHATTVPRRTPTLRLAVTAAALGTAVGVASIVARALSRDRGHARSVSSRAAARSSSKSGTSPDS